LRSFDPTTENGDIKSRVEVKNKLKVEIFFSEFFLDHVDHTIVSIQC
jgi:hypothetical protein